jgi:hypothetical protein
MFGVSLSRRSSIIVATVATALLSVAGVASAQPATIAAPTIQVPTAGIQSAITFVKAHPTEYSGIYFDPSTQQFVVAIPDGQDASAALNTVAEGARQANVANGRQIGLTVVHQTRTLAQLRTIETQVAGHHGTFGAMAGDLVSQWGLNEQTNTVQVGVLHLTSALVAAARQTYGDSVVVSQVQRAYAASLQLPAAASGIARSGAVKVSPSSVSPLSRTLDGQPYSAGDRIIAQIGNNIISCTAGWASGVVRGTQTGHSQYMFTAGHCFPQGTTVYQGYCVITNNLCSAQVTGVMGSVNTVQWGNGRMDWESVNTSGSSRLQQVLYLNGVDSTSGIGEYDLVSAALNEPVCGDGSFTGESCGGTVTSTEGCTQVSDDSGNIINVCNLDFASASTRLVQHGDSGGPVLAADNGVLTGVDVGVISAGNVGTTASPGPGTEMFFTDGGSICNAGGEC